MERTICDIIRNKEKIEYFQYIDALKRYARDENKNIYKLYEYAKIFKILEKVKNYMEVLV